MARRGDMDPILQDDDDDDGIRPIVRKSRFLCSKKSKDGFTYIAVGMGAFAAMIIVSLVISILVGKSTRSDEYAVSSDSDTCAAVGNKTLADGGSGVDAAISTLLCLGVVHPHSSGIGGGGFMLVHNGDNVTSHNFRESAPKAAHKDMYDGNDLLMTYGGLSVAVPGELKGLEHVHNLYGKLPWKDLVMPSVQLARYGFRVERTLVHALETLVKYSATHPAVEKLFEPIRKRFMPNGTIPAEGSNLTRPNFADTLEMIAVNKSEVFYTGSVADNIISTVRGAGGIMTEEDLEQFTVEDRMPTRTALHNNWVMYGAPLPASGPLMAFIGNILAGYGSNMDDSVLAYHRMVEAFKFGYAQRSYLADPGFKWSKGVAKLVSSKLLNRTYADGVRSRISDQHTFNTSYYGGEYEARPTSGTTHLSIVAGKTAVSVTSTINTYFGSLLMTEDGIILNNEMDDFAAPNITSFFDLPPAEPNFVESDKRPLSSQSPTIVCDGQGRIRLVAGASGGTKITTSVFQVYANVHLKAQPVYKSVLEPRLHHQLYPEYIMAEKNLSRVIVDGLRKKGHMVVNNYTLLGVVQAVERTQNGTLRGQSDVVRKGGASFVGKFS